MAKKKGPSPFTHVGEIYKTNGQYLGDEGYAQYIVNKELSKNGELIEVVNELQKYTLPNELHFKVANSFYPLSRRPGFSKFPWIWKGKEKADPEVVGVSKYYEESIENSKVLSEILKKTKEGRKHLKWLAKVYGGKNE